MTRDRRVGEGHLQRSTILGIGVVAALVAGGVAWVAWPSAAAAAAISGTITVTGCSPAAQEVALTATPFAIASTTTPRPTPPVTPTTRTGTTPPTTAVPTTVTSTTVTSTTATSTTATSTTVFTGPIIVSLSTTTAAVNGEITINGHRFGTSPTVAFGTQPATVRFAKDTQIIVIVPPGSGTVDVRVTSNGVTSQITRADRFTYATRGIAPFAAGGVRRDLHSLAGPRPVPAKLPPPAGAALAARVRPTGAHTYAFSVPAAKAHLPYRLSMTLGAGCKGAHVRGPAGGLVVGGAGAIAITADEPGALQVYAGSEQLIKVDGVLRDNWQPTDTVWPFATSGGTRIFHWATAATGTTVGQWQVATQPLGDDCTAAVGLVASGTAPFVAGPLTPTTTSTDFTIDFATIANALAVPVDGFPDGDGPFVTPGSGPKGGSSPADKILGGSNPVQPVPGPTPFTGTFYVRVLPLGAKATCTGTATPSVAITYGVPGTTPFGTSKLEVDTGAPTFDSSFNITGWSWGTSLSFEWNQQPATFRWSSTAAGTATGEWQVSTEPFITQCPDSPGLEFTGAAAYTTGPFVDSGNGNTDLQDGHVFTIDFPSFAEKGALTLYVRVVPRGTDPKACTGPATNTVQLHFQPPAKGGLPKPPPPPPTGALDLSLQQYQPFHALDPDVPSNKWCFVAVTDHDTSADFTKEPDLIGLMANWAGLTHITAGQSFCLTPPGPPDPSFLDQVTEFIVDVVSFPAQVYQLYKAVLPNVIGSFLADVLGLPGCAPPENGQPPSDCYSALMTAEDIGLAALGLPPSLPDLHALLDNGIDELAGEAATELNGVGVPATKEQIASGLTAAKDAIVQQFAAVANQAQGFDCSVDGVTWCAFDGGARQPSVTVRITRPAGSTIAPAKYVCVDIAPSALYSHSCAPAPALAPGASATVRIPLHTTVATLSPSSKYADEWMQFYDECSSTQLQPEEGCTKASDRQVEQTWEGDATNGTIAQLTISAVTSPKPTEAGAVWSVSVVGTTFGCGGNGSPPPEAAAAPCP